MKAIIALFFISQLAFAGDNGGGKIECVSGSGRTKISGMAGADYNGTGPAQITYTIDNKTLDLKGGTSITGTDYTANTFEAVVFAPKDGIYTMKFGKLFTNATEYMAGSLFKMYALPKSFKESSTDIYKFKAVIEAYSVDPRGGAIVSGSETYFDKPIQVSCTLDVTL